MLKYHSLAETLLKIAGSSSVEVPQGGRWTRIVVTTKSTRGLSHSLHALKNSPGNVLKSWEADSAAIVVIFLSKVELLLINAHFSYAHAAHGMFYLTSYAQITFL